MEINLKEYTDLRFRNLEELIRIRFESVQLAVDKANQANEYRLEGLNKFRNSLEDQTRTYVTRHEFDNLRSFLGDGINSIKVQMGTFVTRDESESKWKSNEEHMQSLSKQLYIMVGSLGVIQAIILFLLNKG